VRLPEPTEHVAPRKGVSAEVDVMNRVGSDIWN